MKEMLAGFNHQATISLRKIHRCFELSGEMIDDNFRKSFLRMSNRSLETSYANFEKELNRAEVHIESSERQRSNSASVHESSYSNQIRNSNRSGDRPISIALKKEPHSIDCGATVTSSEEANGEWHDRRSESNRTVPAEEASTSKMNSNRNVIEPNHRANDGNGDEIRIKAETNFEVKQEPIDEAVPMRRFMASEVDSVEQFNSNDNCMGPNISESRDKSRLSKKRAGKSCESSNRETSRSKVAKRFKCLQCEYATDQKGHLNRHMRTHTGERPYRCNRCSKRYQGIRQLRVHMTKHN